MHKDVKFDNILVDDEKKKLILIDWGLSGFYRPDEMKKLDMNVNSKYYKPPEIMTNMLKHDYSVDIWALGSMFASMIFIHSEDHFFRRKQGRDNEFADALELALEIMGTQDFFDFMDKYGQTLGKNIKYLENYNYPKRDWHEFVTPENAVWATENAIDLLSKLLVMDPDGRLAAKDALEHPYFDSIKPDPTVFKEELNEIPEELTNRIPKDESKRHLPS